MTCPLRFLKSITSLLSFLLFSKQNAASELRISAWSSDVCSSDLGARHRGLEDARAQVAILERGQYRLLGGVLQSEQPLAVQVARLGVLRRGGEVTFRQAVEPGLVVHLHRSLGGGGDQHRVELRRQRAFLDRSEERI